MQNNMTSEGDTWDIKPDDGVRAFGPISLAEVFTGLELIGNSNPRIKPALHYWHRE
jgi:hypothetical protein